MEMTSSSDRCSDLWCLIDELKATDRGARVAMNVSENTTGRNTSRNVPPISGNTPSSALFDFMMLTSSIDDDGNATTDDLMDFGSELELQLFSQQAGGPNGRFPGASSPDGFKMAVDWMSIYVTPAIIVVGVVGNALSLSVFSLTHLKRLSSSFYLSTLSIADIVFLVALFALWLQRVNATDLFFREGWCQTVLYVSQVSEFLAAWYVVSFTAERFVTVYYPLRKDSYCTRSRARKVIGALTAVAFVFYLPTFWTHDAFRIGTKAVCSPLMQHQYVITALTGLDTLASCLVPSVVVIALNVRIILKIHQYQKVTLDATRMASTGGTAAAVAATAAVNVPLRRRSMVHTSVSASGSMHIKFTTSKMAAGGPMAAAGGFGGTAHQLLDHQLHHQQHPFPVYARRRQSSVIPDDDEDDELEHKLPEYHPHYHHQQQQQQQHRRSVHQKTSLLPPSQRCCQQDHTPQPVTVAHSPGTSAVINRRLVRGQSQLRTARMLLVLSSLIVLLNFPAHVFRVQAVLTDLVGRSIRGDRDRFTWRQLFEIVHFLNFAVNFFVYSLCGRQFRTGLARLCVRQKICLTRRCCCCPNKHRCCCRCCCRRCRGRTHRSASRKAGAVGGGTGDGRRFRIRRSGRRHRCASPEAVGVEHVIGEQVPPEQEKAACRAGSRSSCCGRRPSKEVEE